MGFFSFFYIVKMSPSLRGSGLKWDFFHFSILLKCLPLYEGVD